CKLSPSNEQLFKLFYSSINPIYSNEFAPLAKIKLQKNANQPVQTVESHQDLQDFASEFPIQQHYIRQVVPVARNYTSASVAACHACVGAQIVQQTLCEVPIICCRQVRALGSG